MTFMAHGHRGLLPLLTNSRKAVSAASLGICADDRLLQTSVIIFFIFLGFKGSILEVALLFFDIEDVGINALCDSEVGLLSTQMPLDQVC